jgi:hypothetical protein
VRRLCRAGLTPRPCQLFRAHELRPLLQTLPLAFQPPSSTPLFASVWGDCRGIGAKEAAGDIHLPLVLQAVPGHRRSGPEVLLQPLLPQGGCPQAAP